MKKHIILSAAITLVSSFTATAIVTLLWNLIIEQTGFTVDWKTSFLFAVVMTVVLPVVNRKNK